MTEPKEQFVVESAQPGSAAAIAEMQARSWLAAYSDQTEFEEFFSKTAQRFQESDRLQERERLIERGIRYRDRELYLIARLGKKITGMLYATKNKKYQTIEALYVDPDHQGEGQGKALVEHTYDWFDKRLPIKLGVLQANEAAQGFYGHLGFKIVPDSEHSLQLNRDIIEITMERKGSDEV